MDIFLTFYRSTNPSVHHEARKVVFSAFKRLNSSLTIFSHPNNQINFKIRKKVFSTFFRLFTRYFPTLTASTARNMQNKNMSWMCFLFPLTIPSKWAISEGHSFKKNFNFFLPKITIRPICPGVVNPGWKEWFQMTANR